MYQVSKLPKMVASKPVPIISVYHIKMNKLKYFVYPLSLVGPQMYSAYCYLQGINHESGSTSYLIFMATLFVLSMIFIFNDVFVLRKKVNKLTYIVPILFTFAYFYDISYEERILEWTTKTYYFFIFFSLPAMFIGSIMAKNEEVEKFYKNLDLLMVILAIGMIVALPKMLLLGTFLKDYNSVSYQSSLAFLYLLYGIISNKQERYKIFKTSIFKYISIVLCCLLVLCALSSGGRGGVVYLFITISAFGFLFMKRDNMIKIIFFVIPLVLGLAYFISALVEDCGYKSVLDKGVNRAFSYISSNGIDMSETSERDISYELAIKNINANPISGYGVFHTIGEYGYPHNILLEILEQGGVLYMLVCFFFIYISIKKCIVILKNDKEQIFLLPLFLFPATMLLFSSSYLITGTFWFSLFYLHNYRLRK